jgi:hypothetical protein
MAWYLVFWRNRSTATVVPAASASQARSRAQRQLKRGYGAIVTWVGASLGRPNSAVGALNAGSVLGNSGPLTIPWKRRADGRPAAVSEPSIPRAWPWPS